MSNDVASNIASEVMMNYPYISIVNDEIKIENYKKIYRVQDDVIHILFSRKKDECVVYGKKLRISFFNDYVVLIKGEVYKIEYVKRIEKC